jgi:hypothetical protein
MTDASGSPADRTIDTATRQRLAALLRDELARVGDEAQARGVPPEEIRARLDDRIARLRAHLVDCSTDGEADRPGA